MSLHGLIQEGIELKDRIGYTLNCLESGYDQAIINSEQSAMMELIDARREVTAWFNKSSRLIFAKDQSQGTVSKLHQYAKALGDSLIETGPYVNRLIPFYRSMSEIIGILESFENEYNVTFHGNKIFIVHGHDHELLGEVDSYIRELGYDTVVLMNEPNGGSKVLIDKFEEHANECRFAVILMTADDDIVSEDGSAGKAARPNVILELGYFLGKFGRDNIVIIRDKDAKMPSDINGITYYGRGEWKAHLSKELATMDN